MGLLDGIEEARFAGVVPHAGGVLPVAPVAAEVVVDEEALVPLRAEAPVEAKVFREVRCHVLAESVAGVAGEEEFAHAGVDEACACCAFEEAGEFVLGVGVLLGVGPRGGGVFFEAADAE